MIDLSKYNLTETEMLFLEDLRIDLENSQVPVELKCGDYSFLIEPGNGGAEVWRFGVMIGEFKTIDDLLLNFFIDGKPFIERIPELEYDD